MKNNDFNNYEQFNDDSQENEQNNIQNQDTSYYQNNNYDQNNYNQGNENNYNQDGSNNYNQEFFNNQDNYNQNNPNDYNQEFNYDQNNSNNYQNYANPNGYNNFKNKKGFLNIILEKDNPENNLFNKMLFWLSLCMLITMTYPLVKVTLALAFKINYTESIITLLGAIGIFEIFVIAIIILIILMFIKSSKNKEEIGRLRDTNFKVGVLLAISGFVYIFCTRSFLLIFQNIEKMGEATAIYWFVRIEKFILFFIWLPFISIIACLVLSTVVALLSYIKSFSHFNIKIFNFRTTFKELLERIIQKDIKEERFLLKGMFWFSLIISIFTITAAISYSIIQNDYSVSSKPPIFLLEIFLLMFSFPVIIRISGIALLIISILMYLKEKRCNNLSKLMRLNYIAGFLLMIFSLIISFWPSFLLMKVENLFQSSLQYLIQNPTQYITQAEVNNFLNENVGSADLITQGESIINTLKFLGIVVIILSIVSTVMNYLSIFKNKTFGQLSSGNNYQNYNNDQYNQYDNYNQNYNNPNGYQNYQNYNDYNTQNNFSNNGQNYGNWNEQNYNNQNNYANNEQYTQNNNYQNWNNQEYQNNENMQNYQNYNQNDFSNNGQNYGNWNEQNYNNQNNYANNEQYAQNDNYQNWNNREYQNNENIQNNDYQVQDDLSNIQNNPNEPIKRNVLDVSDLEETENKDFQNKTNSNDFENNQGYK